MVSSHDRQSTPSRAPEVNREPGAGGALAGGALLTIGELARRAGVSASALRYYEEVGLLPAAARVSGQRRYPESAAAAVTVITLLSEAGFTLAEQRALIGPGDGDGDGDEGDEGDGERGGEGWRQVAERKLAELDEQIARAQAARAAISHGLRCPRRNAAERPDFRVVCPDFQARLGATRPGRPTATARVSGT